MKKPVTLKSFVLSTLTAPVPGAGTASNDFVREDIVKTLGNTKAEMEPGDYLRMGNKLVSWEYLMST